MTAAGSYTPPGYSAQDAPFLFNAATIANFPMGAPPVIQPWSAVQLIHAPAFGVQGFTGYGQLLCDPNTTVALVVLGLQWSSFLENYQSTFHTLAPLPQGLLPQSQPPAQCDWGMSLFYGMVRPSLWKQVLYLQNQLEQFQTLMPVIVVGYGPAAPLAQLAALDLLPGQSFNGMASPATSVSSYAFSCAAFGDSNFVQGFAYAVPQSFVVNLTTSGGLPVDLYPQVSGATGMFVAGSAQGPSATVPVPTCPWLEREPCFYGAALNGTSCSASVTLPAPVPSAKEAEGGEKRPLVVKANLAAEEARSFSAPVGYSPTLAGSLSLLCSSVYQWFEHPGVPQSLPATYSLAQTLAVGGDVWAAIYISPQALTVVFRGPVTWEETVNMWGGSDTSTPIWLPNPGNAQSLTSCEGLYEVLGPLMRTALAQYGNGNTVYLAGHGGGGALASMALWDLKATPISGIILGGVYTFGAAPVGNLEFAQGFSAACGNMSFQIARPLDVIPQLVLGAPNAVVPITPQIQLPGADTDARNGFNYHSVVVYQSLLNPSSLKGLETSVEEPSYRRHLEAATVPWNEVHKCLVNTADNNGKVVLSWDKATSNVTPARYLADGSACIAMQNIVVQPGHELSVESPNGQNVVLVARSLQMGAGSVLRMTTDTTLRLGELRAHAAEPGAIQQQGPIFIVQGVNGADGTNGVSGYAGPNGAPGQYGGPGSPGGMGSHGGNGGNAPTQTISVGTLSGTLQVTISGGAGGNGGARGNGGAGGNGGVMGPGIVGAGGGGGNGGGGGTAGNGGNGSVVTVLYQTMESGTQVVLRNYPAQGGAGGMGGAGAAGGSGSPPGMGGVAGPHGAGGAPGQPGRLVLQQAASLANSWE